MPFRKCTCERDPVRVRRLYSLWGGVLIVRKVAAWLLLFVGAFLLVAAGIAKFWGADAAQRTPLDVDTWTYLSGSADKLNPASGEVEAGLPVRVSSHTQADPKKSDDDVVVFVNTTCVNVDENDPAK